MANYYAERPDGVPEPPPYADEARRAGDFKALVLEIGAPGRCDVSVPCPKVPFRAHARSAFWDAIALSRLRFGGDRRSYAVCKLPHRQRSPPPAASWELELMRELDRLCEEPVTSDTESRRAELQADLARGRAERRATARRQDLDPAAAPRVLTLHVPPGGAATSGYDEMHAALQASYNDDAGGVFERGMRVRPAALRAIGVDPAAVDELERGYELRLREWPAAYRGKHYGGALDHPDKLQAEHERLLAAGFVEGPLHYTPWVVQSLGGVWKPDKGKWRTIMDATGSGVNPASLALRVRYDMLGDAIAGMSPGRLVSSFDLTDAFLNWPYDQAHSDLMGYHDTKGQPFRFRFMAFGGAQSPFFQQQWAERLKQVINEQGLKYCSGAAANYDGFKCVMAYLDDFCLVHPPGVSAAVATEQFLSVMRVLADLGVAEKASKRQLPATTVELLGFIVDTVAQTVSLSQERCERHVNDIDELLASLGDGGGTLGRRELASLAGKLQWCAQVVRGGQLHLRSLYRSRDAFVDEAVRDAPMRARWGRGVRVCASDRLAADLRWWQEHLRELAGAPVYLSNLGVACGFWKGDIGEDDAAIDAAGGVASEDVEVVTTDASGYGGGAWLREQRAAWPFGDDISAPARSSNYRELLTAVLALERWGPLLRGRRVLIRTDNTTTASVLNRVDTRFDTLWQLAERLLAVIERYDLRVAGRHIPGLKNGLADGLSRWRYSPRDDGDWQFDPREFRRVSAWAEREWGRGFDVDACADPVGSNAHCERYWSAVDSALEHDMGGLHVWCNADWRLLSPMLKHFRGCASRRPFDTRAIFCVPLSPHKDWWREVKGFDVLAVYPAGTQLFTRQSGVADGARWGPRERVRPAKWPVVLLAWSAARRDAERRPGGGQVCGDPGPAPPGAAALALRGVRLSGDGPRDAALLRRL